MAINLQQRADVGAHGTSGSGSTRMINALRVAALIEGLALAESLA